MAEHDMNSAHKKRRFSLILMIIRDNMFTANFGPKASTSKGSLPSSATVRQNAKATRSLEFTAIAPTTNYFGTDKRKLEQFWTLRSIYCAELLFQGLIKSKLIKTAVFIWADGEPRQSITYSSCFILMADERWHVTNCAEKYYFACVLKTHWNISSGLDKYSKPSCQENMEFSVPRNG